MSTNVLQEFGNRTRYHRGAKISKAKEGEGTSDRLAEDYSLSSRVGPIVNRNYSNFSIGWLGAVFARRNGSREGWPLEARCNPRSACNGRLAAAPGIFGMTDSQRHSSFRAILLPEETADPRRSSALKRRTRHRPSHLRPTK